MEFRLGTVPEGWSVRLSGSLNSVKPEIVRTGEDATFPWVDLVLDLSGVLTPQTVLLTGAVQMGDAMKKFALSDFRDPLNAGTLVLFRLGKGDFLLAAIASWRIFSGKLLVERDRLTARFYGDGRPFKSASGNCLTPMPISPRDGLSGISISVTGRAGERGTTIRQNFPTVPSAKIWRNWENSPRPPVFCRSTTDTASGATGRRCVRKSFPTV